MRILVINNVYPPQGLGGYEDLCAGAVASWRRAGHDVRVLTSGWRRADVDDDRPPDDEPVTRALPFYWDDHRLLQPGLLTCLAWERRTRALMEDVLRRWPPDVASVWNAGALPFGIFHYLTRAGLPVVLVLGERWLHWGPQADGWLRRFQRPPGRWLAPVVTAATGLSTRPHRLGARTIACFATHHLREHARRHTTWELDADPVVPHGVALERFTATAPDPDPPWTGRLLYVGRIDPRKGLLTVVRALARLPDSHLDVIGSGDEAHLSEVRRLIDELGLVDRVRFRGQLGPEELSRYYRAADVLVFPSEWDEPFGIVPLEAMACATPVIATGTGGSGEFLVDGVTALRYPAGDATALAAAVRHLSSDRDLRARLRSNGVTAAQWLSRGNTYADLLAWHGHAHDPGRAPPGERPLLPPALARS